MKLQKIELLALILFVAFISGTSSFDTCPMGCACNITYNHAKCTTLSGLIRSDRTSSFKSLDLSNIGMRKITSHLDKFTNLEKIDLSGNRLSEVNKLPKGITDLNLSNNRITSAKLAKIPKSVVNLNLSENHITYVPHSIMTLKYLRHLELSGNPINCTCDTLAVRNWLKSQHVWMDRHIICMAPLKFKGRPWLQMKQAEVCEVTIATKKASKFTSKYNWDEIENDNELMQGDQEQEGSGDYEEHILSQQESEEYEDESNEPVEEPEKEEEKNGEIDPVIAEVKQEDLIPVQLESTTTKTETSLATEDDDDEDYVNEEGSGHSDIIPIVPAIFTTEETESSASTTALPISSSDATAELTDDYDDYGSGDSSVPSIPIVSVESSSTTESDITFEPEPTEPSDSEGSIIAVTLPDLNIFDPSLASSTEVPKNNDEVAARSGQKHSTETPDSETEVILTGEETGGNENANVMQAKTDDSKNTFILLGILGVLLICLIIYVAVKDKTSKRNRRNKNDVEKGPAREMKEMNKDLLGKEKGNGHHKGNNHNTAPEKNPLMKHNGNEKPNGHSYPAISPNKIGTDAVDHPVNTSPMSTFKPIKEGPEQVDPKKHDEPNNNQVPNNGDLLPEVHAPPTTHETPASPKRYSPVYTPRTPKLGNNQQLSDPKYSPVYSPETGRVKIKATETQRPKTPVLVTRTKSSAGDYITTADEVH